MNSQIEIEYKLKITAQARRISLRYDHRGLRIITPRKLTESQAQEIIQRHIDWIQKRQSEFAAEAVAITDGSRISVFGDDEVVAYLVTDSAPKVSEQAESLIVKGPEGTHSDTLTKWLRKVAKKGIIARVEEIAAIHKFTYNDVAVRDQVTRWGSCSSQKNLNFSWRLMLAPMDVMDYVIIHELAHTKQMNHSKAFWDVVAACMPDYKIHRKWLKSEGSKLHSRVQ